MLGEKFIKCIELLNSSELNTCIRYSKDTILNHRKIITKTLELYKKNPQSFISLLKNEEKLFKKLFPQQKIFDKKPLNSHFHQMMIYMEEFIAIRKIQQDKNERQRILEGFYIENQAQKEALAVNTKRIKTAQQKNVSFESYLHLYQLYINRFYTKADKFENNIFDNVAKAVDYLDNFYFLAKLHWNQELQANALINNQEYSISFIDKIQTYIKDNPEFSEKTLFKIYAITSALYNSDFDEKRYTELKELILGNFSAFTTRTKRNLITDLSNYISYLYNKTGNPKLIPDIFEIYQTEIKHQLLPLRNSPFPEGKFAQIIRIGLSLKKIDWVENFIKKYKKYLENETLVAVCKAEVLFAQNQFEAMLKTLNTIEINSLKNQYEVRNLYVKCYYKLQEFDVLDNFLASYDVFLRRNEQLSKQLQEFNLLFVKFMKRIIRNRHNTKKLQQIKTELTETKSVFHRQWALDELDLLLA